jgi:WD40 repeat protein
MTTDPPAPPSPAPDPSPADALSPLGPNPFVGPRPYQPGERLFGRRQETRALYYLLSAERIVWLHSPSGAGKTSLVWASLAPMLERDGFAVCPPIRVNLDLPGLAQTVPGANPYAVSVLLSLEERLPQAERRPLPELAETGLADYLKALAEQHRKAGQAGTVLVLDQFEEVLTVHPLDRPAKEAIFQALGEALRDPNLWALFVLREEYLAALEPYVDWIPSRWTNTFRLDLLGREAVLEVLQRAAEQGGRTFTPQAADQLFANLARIQVQQPDGNFREETGHHAEPVQLQVVCRRLWEAMPAEDRSIDPGDLERFGDVTQALGAYYADAVAQTAGGDQALERRIRAWFGEHLIAAGGIRGQVLKGRGASAGLADDAVRGLLDAHLIREEKRAGATWYELAHDRLIAPVLADNADWLAAHLQPFQRQAALWVQQGRPPNGGDQVLSGGTLRDAFRFQKEHPGLLDEDERQLIEISRSARRTRVWTRSLLGLLALVVVAFAGTASWLLTQAREQEQGAWYHVAIGQRKDAVTAAESGDSFSAAQHWAIAAWRFHWARWPTDSANALLALKLVNDRPLLEAAMDHEGSVDGAFYSADSKRILTWSGDGTARLWDSASGAALIPPLKHQQRVSGARFSRDESRILTWGANGAAQLWDSASGTALGPPLNHESEIHGALFSPDESRILTWSRDGTARRWASASGAVLGPPLKHEGPVQGALFSPDGSRILTWSDDSTARVWDSASGTAIVPPLKHKGPVKALFNRDGSRILTWSMDGTARLWDSASGIAVTRPLKHEGLVLGAVLSPNGSRILTWGDDSTARVWNSASGKAIIPPLKHGGTVNGALFTRDGSRILSWSEDGTARLWDSATGAPIMHPLKHDKQIYGALFSQDESRILTWSQDDTARLWDSATGAALIPPLKHEGWLRDAQFSRDESRILTWANDGTARLWDSATGAAILPPLQHGSVEGAQFSPDDSRILTWSAEGTARLWDNPHGVSFLPRLRHQGEVWDELGGDGSWAQLSADGSRILTWRNDGKARLWDQQF